MASITSTVRGGGLGSRAWVARITGTHPTYGLERVFCEKTRNLTGSGRSGRIVFTLGAPGYYEVRNLMSEEWSIATGERSFFVHLTESGDVTEVPRAEVVAALRAPAEI